MGSAVGFAVFSGSAECDSVAGRISRTTPIANRISLLFIAAPFGSSLAFLNRLRLLVSRRNAGDAEAKVAAPIVGRIPKTARRLVEGRVLVPAAAPNHSKRAPFSHLW